MKNLILLAVVHGAFRNSVNLLKFRQKDTVVYNIFNNTKNIFRISALFEVKKSICSKTQKYSSSTISQDLKQRYGEILFFGLRHHCIQFLSLIYNTGVMVCLNFH